MKKHDDEMLSIFIGYDPKEAIAYHACVQSIIENTTIPVSITPLNLSMFKNYEENHTDGSNAFIYSRFLTPYLKQFKGVGLFIDGDMIVNEDLNNLFKLFNPKYAVQVVKHDYKTKFKTKYLGNKNEDYPRKNWSSVVLFNCSHKSNKILTPELISRSKGSYLHRFSWLKDKEIGSLPLDWNYLVKEFSPKPGASLLHYTVGTPCFSEYNNGPEAQIWNNYFSNLIQGFDDLNQNKNSPKYNI